MMIIHPKHILYTTITAIAFLCSSFQDSKACCFGDEEPEEKTEKSHLLPAQKKQETFISAQPTSATANSLTLPLSSSDIEQSASGVDLPLHSLQYSDFSLNASITDPCNTTTGSTAVSPLALLGVQEFLTAKETIISYLNQNLAILEDGLRTEQNEKNFFLSATIPGGDYAIFLTYLPENPSSKELAKCFEGTIEVRKSIKSTFISATLRNHIESNHSAVYQKLAGVLLFVHEQARTTGKIYSVTGQNEYSEAIFDIRDNLQIPSSYPYLYVITGKSTSSTLLRKKNTFFK